MMPPNAPSSPRSPRRSSAALRSARDAGDGPDGAPAYLHRPGGHARRDDPDDARSTSPPTSRPGVPGLRRVRALQQETAGAVNNAATATKSQARLVMEAGDAAGVGFRRRRARERRRRVRGARRGRTDGAEPGRARHGRRPTTPGAVITAVEESAASYPPSASECARRAAPPSSPASWARSRDRRANLPAGAQCGHRGRPRRRELGAARFAVVANEVLKGRPAAARRPPRPARRARSSTTSPA